MGDGLGHLLDAVGLLGRRARYLGDAPGDQKAAKANNALFFPILPGEEESSWERLLTEGIDRFFNGSFAGEYEKSLTESFLARLPSDPPWNQE